MSDDRDEDGQPRFSNNHIKAAGFGDSPEFIESAVVEVFESQARQVIATGDLSRMILSEFVKLV